MLKKYLLNLRPYSWVDILFLGFVAKFYGQRTLSFSSSDILPAVGLLMLWFFFNLVLEARHGYKERGKVSILPAVVALLLSIGIGVQHNPNSLLWIGASTILVVIYLQKNRNQFLGTSNNVVRGLIQSTYFFYAVDLYHVGFDTKIWILGLLIFLLITARSLVGDIRDVKHNKVANKQTVPVVWGVPVTEVIILILLLFSVVVTGEAFNNYWLTLPAVLFGIGLLCTKNGYVLHQLMVVTCTFFLANLLISFTGQSVLFMNLLYSGIFLNLFFYPLLPRKSNPLFVE